MLSGVHSILYSKKPEADREFFQNVLKLTHVDVGEGWLIFGLPPSELAVHPASQAGQELYFMCDDIAAFIEEMKTHKVTCSKPMDRGWGILSEITLPSGTRLGVYQPRHAHPRPM